MATAQSDSDVLRPSPADFDSQQIVQRLESVTDPEIPVLTIRDLGVLRGVRREGQAWVVTITPTYSGCPAMNTIEQDIHAALADLDHDVRVETVLSPAWTSDWLSMEGREKLRAYGIAPPAEQSNDKRSLMGHEPTITCPHCASIDTRKLSEFGSTACKALYTCEHCSQPFDYFKCI